MANTPSFNWETPDDTDLVKDGAAAIRTLGNAIDSSMTDLKGGTTGQVLSKASNTDMDFTWVAQDDSNAIQNAIVDAKGDLISATAADTPARLAVGTNGQFLSANSSTSTGLEWVAAPSSSATLSQVASGSLTGSSVVISGLTQDNLQVVISGYNNASSNQILRLRINSNSSSEYYYIVNANDAGPSFDFSQYISSPNNAILLSDGFNISQTNTDNGFVVNFEHCKAAGLTYFSYLSRFTNTGNQRTQTIGQGYFNVAAQVTSIEIFVTGGSFSAGTYKVIGG